MHFSTPLFLTLASVVSLAFAEVNIEVTKTVECTRKTQRGDTIEVHYRGTLAADGSEFDASYNRGKPLSFRVGQGMVIKGWDEGLLDMCVGEQRTLTIPPDFAYGDRGMPPVIPPKATLIFTTELMGIDGVKKDEL
ncbi:Peptidyl-prolyl cis-trans isomerase fpr2 [Trichoglossum hirsutum]|uniref:peptidylprolyl isomerase n=1 Tax=Trichoglossum hirsutum TaxID=265104 RepID=A0A9P8LFL0_9PEZI|nr:Peptidyl-prolyl cis-trans isomerase fpr2 [Trichoglossum hirsutum]